MSFLVVCFFVYFPFLPEGKQRPCDPAAPSRPHDLRVYIQTASESAARGGSKGGLSGGERARGHWPSLGASCLRRGRVWGPSDRLHLKSDISITWKVCGQLSCWLKKYAGLSNGCRSARRSHQDALASCGSPPLLLPFLRPCPGIALSSSAVRIPWKLSLGVEYLSPRFSGRLSSVLGG